MPPDFKDYPKIEAAFDMTINVLKYSTENKFEPLYTNKNCKEKHADLLLIGDDSGKTHYLAIMDVNRLLTSFVTKRKCSHVFCLN